MARLLFPSRVNASGRSVRVRVFGGFGIVLLLLAAVAAVAKISVIAISTKVGPVENAANVLAVVSDLELRLLETGRQLNAYWATENSSEAELLKQHAGELSAAFARFKQLPHREEDQTLTSQISAELDSYLEIVKKAILVVGGRRKAGEESNDTGIVMRNASGALFGRIEKENRFDMMPGAMRLVQAVESGLLSTSRYVFTRTPADEDKAKVEFERAARELGPLKEAAAGRERILRQLNALAETLPAIQKSLEEIGTATAAVGAVLGQRKQASAKLTSWIQELRSNAAAQHETDLRSMSSAAAWAGRLSILLSAVALLAGLILAWFIGRGIADPIRSMTAAMNELAAGNHEIEVPYSERGDEIGAMAGAVNVFRMNAIEQKVLRDILLEQSETLIAQKEKVEQAAKAKSEFLSNMSHELRTPMHAILSYAKLGFSSDATNGAATYQKYFRNIHASGSRLLGLLNDLLDLAKLESGKMDFKKSPGDFADVIEQSQIELSPLLKDKNLTLTTEITANSTASVFDKQRMIQVVINLISNSIKFSPAGSGISVGVCDARMPDGSQALCCSAGDEGPGIPKIELEAVFDKFIQSSKTKSGAGGSGLGLSICREILKAHGGKIWAENREPTGAVFSFLIPHTTVQQAS